MTRLPPFAQSLAERQKFQNLPFLVIICIGRRCWPRARRWNNSPNDCVGLMWPGDRPPSGYTWPVSRCACIIEWDIGPTADQITGLIKTLLLSGARSITSRPLFIDPEKTAWYYDLSKPIGNRWTQNRELVRTFSHTTNQQGGRNAA